MLSGLDIVGQLDDGLLTYSDLIPSEDAAVHRWRSVVNLAERQALETLHIRQVLGRNGLDREAGPAILRSAQAVESQLLALAKSLQPTEAALRASSGIAEESASYFDDPDTAVIAHKFRVLGDELTLPFSDPELDPLLESFHGAEPNGRWTGPKTLSTIRLPLGALVAAGARSIIIRTLSHQGYGNNGLVNLYAGKDLEPIALSRCIIGEDRIVFPLKSHADAEMIVLKIDNVFTHEPDSRAMGIFIESLTISAQTVEALAQ